jgi:hypothetical protein
VQDRFLDLTQLLHQLLHRDAGPSRLGLSDITNSELNRLLKKLLLAIRDPARDKSWPEIAILIYDEPTECLLAEHENRYNFIKSFWPEVRIYGVTMNRVEGEKSVSHMVDIFVANGAHEAIRKLADETGKPFWVYTGVSSWEASVLRHTQAGQPWKYKAGKPEARS